MRFPWLRASFDSPLFGLLLATTLAASVGCSTSSSSLGSDGGAGATGAGASDGGTDATLPPSNDDAGTSDASDGGAPADAGSTETPDAALAGPVGVTTRTWVDTTRPTPANGTAAAQTSRTLVTEVWYPTSASGTGALRDAPLAPGGPYPLVLFVHGSSSGRTVSTFLAIALAQAGYVVAAADFPLTALTTAGGPSDLGVSAQVGDLSFLCDQLKAASLSANDALKGAVDGLSYAVVGHSTGGTVAELAAFGGDDAMITHDPRVAAVVPLSGDSCMYGPGFFKTRSVPILVIGATNDLFVPYPDNGAWAFANTNEPHLSAELVGGEHMHFTDLPLDDGLLGPVPTGPTSPLAVTLQAYGDASACLPVPEAGTAPLLTLDAQHTLTTQLVRAYLDAQLRKQPALLDALEAANSPLVIFQK